MDFSYLLEEITRGFTEFSLGNAVMVLLGLGLITLAVVKEYEPVLLLPIGFGCIMANIGMSSDVGFMKVIYDAGIKSELFPLLIFIGVGAMIDFSPLLAQPKMVLLGAAGQFGIYLTLLLALLLGFPMNEAASIGVIGAIDGPTAIFVGSKLAPEILAPIAVAAYSYMSLIPIIQPPIMKLSDHAQRALDQNGICPPSGFTAHIGGFPNICHLYRQPGGTRCRSPDCFLDVGEFAQREPCCGPVE